MAAPRPLGPKSVQRPGEHGRTPAEAMTDAPEPEAMDDPGLRRRVLAGDPEAIDRWFRAQHPAVYRLCLGFLADPAEAEDVAQDAMLHLHDRLERFDDQRPWQAWRNTLVLNLCRDRLRRRAARARAEEDGAERWQERPGAVPADPGEVASARELRSQVTEALDRLSPREREAFVLRDLEGMETVEVAAALGVGTSTVRSLVTLARRRLRRLLGPQLGQPQEAPDHG